MSARQLSAYLRINEKKIYQLAKDGNLPHVWIGGKIAFPREVIDKWILENTERPKRLTVAGSDDPLLRQVIDIFNGSGEALVFYAPLGSIPGLKALERRSADMSCVHILDIDTGTYNTSYLERYLSGGSYRVIHLFRRQQGLMLQPSNPRNVEGLEDLVRKNVPLVNRKEGTGTRLLLDFLLKRQGIDPPSVKGYATEASSHLEAGLKVMRGEAQAAFGIRYIAEMLGFAFVPLHEEEFHLVVPEENFLSKTGKAFLAAFDQALLVRHLGSLAGYDLSRMGEKL